MSSSTQTVTAFAPASVANVAVGFDIVGFAMDQVGDRVTVARLPGLRDVSVRAITGVVTDLPFDARKNTATVALQAMIKALDLDFGFEVSIHKGISLGSGMGGSAASAVGAVVAAHALVNRPVTAGRLLEFALAGEAAASGAIHADNVAPCFYGGLTLTLSVAPLRIVQVPIPAGLQCVLVHPHLQVETRSARAILEPTVQLQMHVRQSAHLAAFVAACHQGDLDLLQASMKDFIIEPQRASLIPGFYEAKRVAMAQGALGFSIAGSGPSVFAWADSIDSAGRIRQQIVQVFAAQEIPTDSWICPVQSTGARVIS